MKYEEYNIAAQKADKMKKEWLAEALKSEALEKMQYIDTKKYQDQYEEKVVPYWEKYGIKPDRMWYEYYGSRDYRMDPQFIPDDLYYTGLIPYLNNMKFQKASADKCYLDLLFPEIKQAETVVKYIAGEYFDADMNLISKESAYVAPSL